MGAELTAVPAWAEWAAGHPTEPFTVGVEEEVMLLEPASWALAHAIDEVLPRVPPELARHLHPETHAAVLELATGVARTAGGAVAELRRLRDAMRATTAALDLAVASAGMHPFAVWRETLLSGGDRYRVVYGSVRELARREPTFALHVHVGVPDREDAIRAVNRLRPHLPLLLALSANSPFWQGRDTGLASARTPLFQGFPRVGIPRTFADYADYASSVDLLMRVEAFPEPTFLWWDVRPQPRLGTVEVRIVDAQTDLDATAALVALVQSVVALELEEAFADERCALPEALVENRFIAARDGARGALVDVARRQRTPVAQLVRELLDACRPHAQDLGCEPELDGVEDLVRRPLAERQLAAARRPDRLRGLVAELAARF